MAEYLQEENQKLKQAVEELSLLNEIATAVSSTMPMEEINKLIVGKCLSRIRAEQGYISLVDNQEKSGNTHTLVRVFDKSTLSVPFRLGITLTGWMVKNQTPLLVNDALADERFQGTEWNGVPVRSVLAVPLKVKNRLIGFMALFNRKGGDFTPEDQRLLSIVGMQSAQTIEAARLYEEEKRAAAMEEDLRAAKTIQQNLLPKALPEIPGFEAAGFMIPAKEVGGDYYDFLALPEGRWGFVVADVSGKGLPAAFLMSNLQGTVRSQSGMTGSCAQCVVMANRMLKLSVSPGQFATLFLAALDPVQKTLSYCNAGHNPPYLFKPDGSFRELTVGGPLLGPFDGLEYAEEKLQLASGDVLVIFSDGVTEATSETDEMFGEARLIETVKPVLNKSAQEILAAITDVVRRFAGNAPAADDLTLMVIKAL
ncbi:MAG: SpoIIE family protein phosphatase [candidate division Zixibacteria bacterium]|nr:SpoIIE family protein phosphatase [candidate division Zixibacteria bacterium]MCI0596859.1 SpoIIE family protein phosphatase [candidate division Zixibacteria bacterium]